MSKTKLIVTLLLVAVVMLGAGGAGAWWLMRPKDPAKEVEVDTQEYRYVSLDKVIVMLRGKAGEPMSHYLAVDLVIKTPLKTEKTTKEHLPLLRSVAVKALSAYTLDRAAQMSVEEFAAEVNRAFSESYSAERAEKPFAEAMIGKLIIE